MNYTTINTTSVSCGSVPYLFLSIAERLAPELRAVFLFRFTINAISCPIVILLNILVMIAVKTNRQLRTKSNVSLACLATTNPVVGLVVQPLQIVRHSLMLEDETGIICGWVDKMTVAITLGCVMASLQSFCSIEHRALYRCKTPFRIRKPCYLSSYCIEASGLMWAAAIILLASEHTKCHKTVCSSFYAVSLSCVLF